MGGKRYYGKLKIEAVKQVVERGHESPQVKQTPGVI